MKFLCVLCVLFAVSPALALDREAFTFTRYDLDLTIDSGQQRLGCRGKITLRNDSGEPQRNVVLQISSTLHWASIQVGGKAAVFVTQTYTSDVDHSGALSEAILTLQKPIAPKGTIDLSVGYEGVIAQDATRLTRIGVPAETAKHSDWDQISAGFTGVRGIGYVAWYPVATEAANMSEASAVSETVGRWQRREDGSEMALTVSEAGANQPGPPVVLCNGKATLEGVGDAGQAHLAQHRCTFRVLKSTTPFLVMGNFQRREDATADIFYLPEHKSGADNYALALNQVSPSVSVWLGGHTAPKGVKPRVIDLPDANAAPFESDDTLLLPLTTDETSMLLMAVQQVAKLDLPSPRSWISQGLAGYLQARYVEQEKERGVAIGYLQSHRVAMTDAEENPPQGTDRAEGHALINSTDEFYVQSKAANVWWMLRDLVGETAVIAALRTYNADDDKEVTYMQKLLEAQSHRDLGWFFDDWVYHDRGLPDFRVASVFSSSVPSGGFLVTVTVENLGSAAAEIPVTVQMAGGEAAEPLLVPGKSKASVRILAASKPVKVILSDGRVPESNMSNNEYTIESLNH